MTGPSTTGADGTSPGHPPGGRDGAEALVARLITGPFERDPYPLCAELRELEPVHRSELGFWCASDFASCQLVFRSPAFGQGFNTTRLDQDPRFATSLSLQMFSRMIPFMDPPDHTRIRRILQPYFTPRAIEQLRHYAVGLVDQLLGDLAANGGGDLVADFAEHIPVAVVCEILGGLGTADQGKCRAWAEGLVEAVHPLCDETMMRHADDSAEGFRRYFLDLLAATPADGDNLLSRLLVARADGEIDEEELLATATTLVGAAYHNTRNHIAMSIATMVRHPDQLAVLRADLDRASAAVEELLRYDPPVQVTLPRLALRDITVGGVELAEGEQICGLLGGANRDPARYAHPDILDISRTDGGSLALASGTHSCIGAAMARMESEVALRGFFGRFDRVTLLDDEPPLDLPGLPLTRGFTSIRVEL